MEWLDGCEREYLSVLEGWRVEVLSDRVIPHERDSVVVEDEIVTGCLECRWPGRFGTKEMHLHNHFLRLDVG